MPEFPLRYFFLDADNALVHAYLSMNCGIDEGLLLIGSSNQKPAVVFPLFLRNMMQDPNDYTLKIEYPPSENHVRPEAAPEQDP